MRRNLTSFVLALLFVFAGTSAFAQSAHSPKGLRDLVERPCPSVGSAAHFRSAFDTKQGLDSIVGRFWDDDLGLWVPEFKETHTYNADGLESQFQGLSWDEDVAEWFVDYQEDYSYDANGHLTASVSKYWDDVSMQWMPSDSTSRIYDTGGQLVETSSYFWDAGNSVWEPSELATYSYNGSGQLDTVESSYWSGTAWELNAQEVYNYDGDGRLVELDAFYWSGFSWEPDTRDVYTYDADGRLIEDLYQIWDFGFMQWNNVSKEEYGYDAFGNVAENITSYWDEDAMVWEPDTKLEGVVYDNDYSFDDLLLPVVYQGELDFLFNHKLDSALVSGWTGSGWTPVLSIGLYYSEYTFVGTSEPQAEELGVFPNPATDRIVLQLPEDFTGGLFRLFDVQGREILQGALSGAGEIDVAALSPGMYFYTLSDEHRKMYGKFVKQ